MIDGFGLQNKGMENNMVPWIRPRHNKAGQCVDPKNCAVKITCIMCSIFHITVTDFKSKHHKP